MDEETRKQILSFTEEVMQGKGLSKMKIDLTGTNKKGEGYVADFTYATVTGIDKADKHKEIHLAIKSGKKGKKLRESMPMLVECYKRELFLYEKIFPAFRKFQLDKNIENPFNAVPKCYKTFLSDTMEVLVMENLKKKGFALHDKKQPMNLSHIKVVLKNYAKLHALSFALRDQKEDEFNELTSNLDSIIKRSIPVIISSTQDGVVPEELRNAGRNDLAEQYEELMKKGKAAVLLEILEDIPRESVITHGDCNPNNFLFEYKDDYNNPSSVSIIDWQNSELNSPVMDLSYFMHCVGSEESLAQLDILLRFYHSHFMEFLRKLGSDPDKLFPYSKLVEHWKKYSAFSFLMITGFLQISYVDKEDAMSLEGFEEKGKMERLLQVMKKERREAYRHRLISIVDHFFSFKPT